MTPEFIVQRIRHKLCLMFGNLIDGSDLHKSGTENEFDTRSLAALAILMKWNANIEIAAQAITDNDNGIDAIYIDEKLCTLFFVQSKWRSNGSGSIKQAEITSFTNGIKRIIDGDFDDFNANIKSMENEIIECIGILIIKYKQFLFILTMKSYL